MVDEGKQCDLGMLREYSSEMVISQLGAGIEWPADSRRKLQYADVRRCQDKSPYFECAGLLRLAMIPATTSTETDSNG